MTRLPLTESLLHLAKPVVASLGLEIWGLELLQGGRPVVRLFIESPAQADTAPASSLSLDADGLSPEGVTVDQCAHVSRLLGLALEVEDIFSGAFVIEVSSPGLSRQFFTLAQMQPYIGHMIELTLRDSLPEWPMRKKFRGHLDSVADAALTLVLEHSAEHTALANHVTTAWENVRRAARVHIFAEPRKPGKKTPVAAPKAIQGQ